MMKIWELLSKWEKGLLILAGLTLFLVLTLHIYPLTVSQAVFLSLDNVKFITDDPIFQGRDTWLAYFAVFGGGQYLQGTTNYVSPEAISSDMGQAERGFTFSVTNMYDYCDYMLEKQTEIVQYRVIWAKAWWDFLLPGDANKACSNDGGQFLLAPAGNQFWCMSKEIVGSRGRVSSIQERWESQMTLAIDGRTPITTTLSSSEQTSATMGGIAHVSWTGSFWTGMQCPTISNIDPILYQNTWRFAKNSDYATYIQKLNAVESTIATCKEGIYGFIACDGNELNRKLKSLSSQIDTLAESDEVIHGNQNIVGDRVEVRLSQPIAIPSFTLRILADELGIAYFLPQPKIDKSNTYCPTNQERSGGVAYVTIKNDKDQAGSITVVVSCDKAQTGTYSSREVYDAGESKTITIPLNLGESISSNIKDNCIVTAYASDKSDVQDSYSFYCDWEDFVGCTPGAKRCSEDATKIVQCNSQGTGWNSIGDCKYGCALGKCNDNPTSCDLLSHDGCQGDEICKSDNLLNTYCSPLECKSNEVGKDHKCVSKSDILQLPLLWALVFAVVGFAIAGYIMESTKLEEARKRMATLLIALLFAMIPIILSLMGTELPDIQSGFTTCEATGTFPFQIASMLGIPLDTFMWFFSIGLGVIAGLILFTITRDMGFGMTIQGAISAIIGLLVFKLICTTFWIGVILGMVIAAIGLILIAFFPEAVAGWGIRLAKGGMKGLKK